MRFMIEIDNNELVLSERYGARTRVALDDLDAYVKALYAARDFAIANADPPENAAAECGNTTTIGVPVVEETG